MSDNAQLTTPGPAVPLSDRADDAQITVHEVGLHYSDTDAFAEFYQKHFLGTLRFAAYLLPTDRALVEDVIQDAFLEVWRRWETIQEPGAYLRKTVARKVIDFRRQRTIAGCGLPDEAYDLPAPQAEGPAATALAAEDSRGVLTALNQIPPKQREVLVLHYMMDLRVQEIAEILDSRPETVRSNIRHGLRSLRRYFIAKSSPETEFQS